MTAAKKRLRSPSPAARELHLLNAHRRLLLSVLLTCATAFLTPAQLSLPIRLAIAWDAGVVLFLALTWWLVRDTQPDQMQETVLAHDQGRVSILTLGILAASASFLAIFFLMQKAKGLAGEQLAAQVGLSVLTIICSWILMHVMYALHYAHRFYRDDPATRETDATGGLRFPGDSPPDYWDFLYLALTIGMTFQVSDVQVTCRPMRRLVLWHSTLSFAFYTVVLALCINIVAGLI